MSILLTWIALTPISGLPSELLPLKAKLGQIENLRADFTQKRYWSALKEPLITRGTVSFTKPDRLHWKTLPPAESELILTGKRAVIRYPALKTEETFDFSSQPGMGAAFENILAVFQGNFEKLEPLYNLAILKTKPLQLQLQPKSEKLMRILEKLELTFRSDFLLDTVVVRESGGDRTEISFQNQKVEPSPRY
jgi:outer membrane lipoprotein-sorting protein